METSGRLDRVEAPRWLVEHAQRFQASGARPAEPRLAATVVLLRDEAGGLQVYTQRRAATMAFAAGMYAFPGGSVAPEDSEPLTEPPTAAGPEGLADRLGLPEASARAVLRAAVRELAEETGVRLAPDRLAPWSRWLTPEFEPRRYDTFFFLAALPAGQQPAEADGEADHGLWLPPAEALRLPMLPPTRYTLAELARFPDAASAIAAAAGRDLSQPVRPVIEIDAEGAWLVLANSDG